MKQSNVERLQMEQGPFTRFLVVDSVLAGILGAVICIIYRLLLTRAEALYFFLINYVYGHRSLLPAWFLGLIILGLIISKFLEWEPDIGGSGIPQVEAEVSGYISQRPIHVIFSKIGAGALGIIGGLSLGREGPSIQLGAMAGKIVSRLFHRTKTEEKYLLTCGAAAGLSAAFNAPLAGVLFSVEELHKRIGKTLLVSAMCAAILSDYLSKLVFGLEPTLNLTMDHTLPFYNYFWIVLLGIVCGLFGSFYNRVMMFAIQAYAKIKFVRSSRYVIFPLLVSGILGIWMPAAMCGGHRALLAINDPNSTFIFLLLLLIVKFLFSVGSFGSGAAGGIFYPLLILGALLGALFGKIALYFGVSNMYYINFIIIGTASIFAAIVQAPITGVILVAEMSGTLHLFLPLVLSSFIAYFVAHLCGNKPIYDSLLDNLLHKKKIIKKEAASTHTIVNTAKYVVAVDAPAAHATVEDLDLPETAWIVSIERGNEELIPHSTLRIRPGDTILLIYNENKAVSTHTVLHQLFTVNKE